jgi:hypothetical protein
MIANSSFFKSLDNGVMEYWATGVLDTSGFAPVFQYSSAPILRYSNAPLFLENSERIL